MGDLIDRKKAIESIEEMQNTIMRSNFSHEQFVFRGLSDARRAILDLPSVKPLKGEWIDHYMDEGYVECPFCHSATNCSGDKDELHYCFSCGAELR